MAAGFGEYVACDVLLYPVATRIHLARGDLEAAERACRRVDASTTWFSSTAWVATAHEMRGLVAEAGGDLPRAADQLDQARQTFADLAQPHDVARCQAALNRLAAR